VLAIVVLATFVAAAHAEPVQEFSFELRDIKPDGRFTVVYTQRSYDTTGAVPVSPNEFRIRLPAGAKLRKEFLVKRLFCDTKKLFEAFDPKACRRSQIGTGRVLVDARPFITELIPANLWLFLARGTTRSAVASMAILGKPDPAAPIVRNTPIVRDFRAPITFLNFFHEPTPDGKYGYRVGFGNNPSGGSGVSFSIAETRLVTSGFTITKQRSRCVKRVRGRCARRKLAKRKLFWFKPPACPPSGRVSFEAFFGYQTLPDVTRVTELSCPKFGG
jgi:hypothetical protein